MTDVHKKYKLQRKAECVAFHKIAPNTLRSTIKDSGALMGYRGKKNQVLGAVAEAVGIDFAKMISQEASLWRLTSSIAVLTTSVIGDMVSGYDPCGKKKIIIIGLTLFLKAHSHQTVTMNSLQVTQFK